MIGGENIYKLPFQNGSGETVPAFGVILVSGTVTITGYGPILNAAKPEAGANPAYFINGGQDVANGEIGYCANPSQPVFARFTSGAPANGELWGPDDSFDIQLDKEGFQIIGAPANNRVLVVAQSAITSNDTVGVLLSIPGYSWSTTNANLELLSWKSDEVVLWDGERWVKRRALQGTPPSIAASGESADTTYNIYAFWDTTTDAVKIETGTAAEPVITDGICTKSGDKTRRFMGIARTNATPAWEDTVTKRYISNYYIQLKKEVIATVNTGGTADTDIISVVDIDFGEWFIWLNYHSRVTNSTVTTMPTATLKRAAASEAIAYGLTLTEGGTDIVTAYDIGLSLSWTGQARDVGGSSGKVDFKVTHAGLTTIQAGTFKGAVMM